MGRSNKRSKKMKWGGDPISGQTDVESNSNNPRVTAVPGPESITPPVGVAQGTAKSAAEGAAQSAAEGAAPETTSWFSMSTLSSLNPFAKKPEDLASEIMEAEAKVKTDKAALDALIKQKSETQVGGRRRSKKTKHSKRSNKKRSNKRRSSKKRTHKRRHR